MKQLSRNFNLSEFERSATAQSKGIYNQIPARLVPNVSALVNDLLQPLVDYIANQGGVIDRVYVIISSGYRSEALNKLVGGVSTSQHLQGEAADIIVKVKLTNGDTVTIEPSEVRNAVLASGLPYDQMILYNGFTHLSYTAKRPNRYQLLYNKSYTGKR